MAWAWRPTVGAGLARTLGITNTPTPAVHRSTFAIGLSVVLLGACMVAWPALFLFSKTLHAPKWAEALPSLFYAAPLLSLVALAPIPLLTFGGRNSGRGLLVAVLLSPLTAATLYWVQNASSDESLVFNTVFNYFWVLGFHLLGPAVVLFCVKAAVTFALSSVRAHSDA